MDNDIIEKFEQLSNDGTMQDVNDYFDGYTGEFSIYDIYSECAYVDQIRDIIKT